MAPTHTTTSEPITINIGEDIVEANAEEDNAEASIYSAWWIAVILVLLLVCCCFFTASFFKQRRDNNKVLSDLKLHKTALDNPTYAGNAHFALGTTATGTGKRSDPAALPPAGGYQSALKLRAGVVANQVYAVPVETSESLYMDADTDTTRAVVNQSYAVPFETNTDSVYMDADTDTRGAVVNQSYAVPFETNTDPVYMDADTAPGTEAPYPLANYDTVDSTNASTYAGASPAYMASSADNTAYDHPTGLVRRDSVA